MESICNASTPARSIILLGLLIGGAEVPAGTLDTALSSITTNDLLRHVRVLSSDEFEGRAPGSKGEALTVRYLIDQFEQIGLKPGDPTGSWVQAVPLAGIKSTAHTHLQLGDTTTELIFPQDCVVWSAQLRPEINVQDSPVVFVGYGVEAPEYDWDDFKGIDVRGKTLLILVNDPPLPDPNQPDQLDPNQFQGRAMTYYGRWTYKYEVAARKGAAAAFIIHETGPAGYPYFVVINSWGRENFTLDSAESAGHQPPVAAWMSFGRAQQFLKDAGFSLEELKERALRRDFQPVHLNARVNVRVENTIRRLTSQNVVAKLPGSDPDLRDEYVLYTAHWDHIGRNDQLEGDQIFNGAMDNATGVAGLLELAEAFRQLPTPPRRSLLFLAVTAEEQGLLGARFYAENPLYPLSQTLANLNMDGLNTWGRKLDFGVIGYGNSSLDGVLAEAAQPRGFRLEPERSPEKGYFFRSDHFEFAKKGVPALYLDSSGEDYVGRPADYGKRKREEYTANDYHKVSDEVKEDWDLTGAVDELHLMFEVGWRVSEAAQRPKSFFGPSLKK